ncbi:MAG: trypsin-like peptidase domain-containing protein [Lachnospiraceae bacterium]|nr:trypsin-like peptidase domain-containing protein [Lachnospiraceae bacterium]MDE6233903.1 trypsin-like peptidase domain-containing protein [Lachnospiraceae bacterium]MDE6251511.1 trypsin-like peptidase domain-containing protein [Lachnospiraceae bacterium]
MSDEIFKTRHNIMNISSMDMFTNIKGGMNSNCKDVYFVRVTGTNPKMSGDIEKMDKVLTERMCEGKGYYNRAEVFPRLSSPEDIDYYTRSYSKWVEGGKASVLIKSSENSRMLQNVLGKACSEAVNLFKKVTANVTESIEKNFIIKMLYWFDKVGMSGLQMWEPAKSMKFVTGNICKKQEYLFCYLLTLTGFDVLLLQCEADIDNELGNMGLSLKIQAGSMGNFKIPAYEPLKYSKDKEKTVNNRKSDTDIKADVHRNVVNIKRADRERRKRETVQPHNNVNTKGELSFEELAQLASSVVMIAIMDKDEKVIGTGSGIMIGRDGYILTNHHVASGGAFYSVKIEDDDEIYTTDEFIKYNYELDLAIIRIERKLQPLPIYKGGKELVRGQKVVAIGSPLGLFNSVSDGIISGFRKINGVDMIQFTAPISHGSSGGAVLNMCGEVIGISTAGFDDGQNINLAMGYECINSFIRGFT